VFGEIFQVVQPAETAVQSLVAAEGEPDARTDLARVLEDVQPEDAGRSAGGEQERGLYPGQGQGQKIGLSE